MTVWQLCVGIAGGLWLFVLTGVIALAAVAAAIAVHDRRQ